MTNDGSGRRMLGGPHSSGEGKLPWLEVAGSLLRGVEGEGRAGGETGDALYRWGGLMAEVIKVKCKS